LTSSSSVKSKILKLRLAISSAPFSPSPSDAPSLPDGPPVGDDGREDEPFRAEASWRMRGRRRGDVLMFL
jgi:hypothetical protein